MQTVDAVNYMKMRKKKQGSRKLQSWNESVKKHQNKENDIILKQTLAR